MPKFRSTKELLKYLQSTIDEVLTEDVFPVIQEAEIDTIMEVVYSQKTSGYYRRRGDAEGMGDPYNIEIQGGVAKNGILSVVNVTVPNPYLNGANERGGYASQNKHLPEVIEHGKGYDYWKKPKKRPFTAKTIERLQSSGECTTALKNGLRSRGIDVSNA